ncbi:unnamed protein product [Ascophyllum nodosum]
MRSTLCALFACISVAVMVVASLILFQREAIYYPDERQYSIQTPAEVTDAQAPNEQSTAEISMDLLPPPSNGGNQEGWEEEEQFRRDRVPHGEGPYGIKYVSLIAERHSGSSWMSGFLRHYFKTKEVFVSPTLCTWKHWFQDRIHEDIQAGKRPCREEQQCPACLDIQHTLVIALWRNPYDWVSAMQTKPHHSIAHTGIKNLNTFLTKRWMLDPKAELAARKKALLQVKNQAPCIDNFLPWEVVPCRKNDRTAIYEVDEDGKAYGNIYELRKAKIRDFNAVQEWAPFYEKILYEDVVVDGKLQEWLRSLSSKYGLDGDYANVPDAHTSHDMSMARSHMYYPNKTCEQSCAIGGPGGKHARATLNRMWDAQLEEGLGYHKL